MLPSPARQITRFPGTGKGRSDGGGQVVTHGGGSGVGDQTLALSQTHGLERHDAGCCVAADYDVVVGEFGRELLDEVVRIQGRAGLALAILHDGVALDAFAAPGEPRGVSTGVVVFGVTLT